ncbi:MAG TPA: aldo/keto reductase [Acidimicrobiales bacterium]
MNYITLGKSELKVSRVAFGTWQLGGDWGVTDTESATLAIRQAAESGVNFFDTAQAYGFGASEELLAKALRGIEREDLIIATKGGLRPTATGVSRDSSAAWITSGVDASLRALDTDYIDLYQVHWPDAQTPFEETAEALAGIVASGKIRHVGVSNFDATQMETFSAVLSVETDQPAYHIFRRDVEHELFPYTTANNIGVLVYGPLAHGLLGGNLRPDTRFASDDWRATSSVFQGVAYEHNLKKVAELEEFAQRELGITIGQLAVAWTLANPAVHVAIVGTRNPSHVQEALAAGDLVFDASTMSKINDIIRGVVLVDGPSPEGI